jgi:hypothetical protein
LKRNPRNVRNGHARGLLALGRVAGVLKPQTGSTQSAGVGVVDDVETVAPWKKRF